MSLTPWTPSPSTRRVLPSVGRTTTPGVLLSAMATEIRSTSVPKTPRTATTVPTPMVPAPQASTVVIVVAVLDAIRRYWPGPLPSVIRTMAPTRPPWATGRETPLSAIVRPPLVTAVTVPPREAIAAGATYPLTTQPAVVPGRRSQAVSAAMTRRPSRTKDSEMRRYWPSPVPSKIRSR